MLHATHLCVNEAHIHPNPNTTVCRVATVTVAVSLIITDMYIYVQRMNKGTNLLGFVPLQRPDLEKHL